MVGRGKNLIKPLFVNGLSSLLEPVVVLAVTKKENIPKKAGNNNYLFIIYSLLVPRLNPNEKQ